VSTGDDHHVAPVAAVGICCDRRCGGGDAERESATLHRGGGGRRHRGRQRTQRSHSRLSPRAGEVDRLDPGAGQLLPHHARGRGGVEGACTPRQPSDPLSSAGLGVGLQRAGDALSDELDEEEEINQQADIPYTVYPCPVPAAPYPARAIALRVVEQRVPACRRQADALRVSFEARRRLMQQCLRRPGL
jgi:hypothetical protein